MGHADFIHILILSWAIMICYLGNYKYIFVVFFFVFYDLIQFFFIIINMNVRVSLRAPRLISWALELTTI
jgi:hypothetical protein